MPEWWREYPERDCEYVTYYPVAIEPLAADEVWETRRSAPEELGLYIHVPLCSRICPFCNYNKFSASQHDAGGLAAGIVKELQLYGDLLGRGTRRVTSIYFGGGTPSTFSTPELEAILGAVGDAFTLAADAEISVEIHPTDASRTYLEQLRALGVDRASFGLQSFNDRLLEVIGSHHTAADARAAVEAAHAAGFENIVADLMFLLPTQSTEDWVADIETMVGLDVRHISLYRMLLDPSGPLARKIRTRRGERQ